MRGSREGGEEEFVHDACTRDANRTLLFARGMRCHDDTAPCAIWSHRDLWTIVEAAHHLAFRTLLDLISRKVQTLLNQRVIEHAVFFATGHKREPSHIGEHGSGAILPVEPQQGARSVELRRREIAPNGRDPPTQFLPVMPVAAVAKRAEPTFSYEPEQALCACEPPPRVC